MCHKLVAKVLYMLKNIHEPVKRLSYVVCASVTNLLPQNFGEFTMQQFRDTRTTVVQQSWENMRTTCDYNLRLSGEKIKLSDIGMDVVRHFHKCLATVKLKLSHHCQCKFKPNFVQSISFFTFTYVM